MRGLGLQLKMSVAVVLSLWCFGAPLIYFVGVAGDGGSVEKVWKLMFVPYVAMNLSMLYMYINEDFKMLSDEVVEREKEQTIPIQYKMVGEKGGKEEEEEEEEVGREGLRGLQFNEGDDGLELT